MKHYVGMDVSQQTASIYNVDEEGPDIGGDRVRLLVGHWPPAEFAREII